MQRALIETCDLKSVRKGKFPATIRDRKRKYTKREMQKL